MAVLFCFTLSAQDYGNAVPDTSGNPLSDEDVQSIIMLKTILNDKPAYELYRTENMWTFLKLETSSGKIWQVQYAVGDGDAFETVLSDVSLAFDGVEINGRFRLYPTDNIYNFILLDTSATGARFTLMPRVSNALFFSQASEEKTLWLSTSFCRAASSWGEGKRAGKRLGFRLARVTEPPSSSEPMSRGMPVSARAAS